MHAATDFPTVCLLVNNAYIIYNCNVKQIQSKIQMATVGLFHGFVTGLGGAERVASSLARGLVKASYRVNVYIIVSEGNSALKSFREWMPSEVEITPIRLMKGRRFKKLGLYQNLEDFIWYQNSVQMAEQSNDVIVQTGGGLQPFVRTQHRRISYCQALWRFDLDNKYHGGLWNLYSLPYEFIMKRKLAVLRNAKHLFIVANSNYTKQHLLTTWNIDDSNVCVIYPPVDIMKWHLNADNNFQQRSGLVNVGRFSTDKNHKVMFDIVKGLSTALTLIGNTADAKDELYLKKLKQNASANIRFLENMDQEIILEELHKAKVYLHSSHETFGLSIVEAIAAGCIPVVPDNSAHKETVPFPELRYNSVSEAHGIIQDALHDKFDYLLPKLKSYIKQFDEAIFHSKMNIIIDSILVER